MATAPLADIPNCPADLGPAVIAATKAGREGPARTKRQAGQSRLVRDYAGLIHELARRVSRRVGHTVDFDDLVSEGTIGLLQAADRFDAHRQVKFESYATTRIHGAMLDYLRGLDPLSQRRRREASRVRRAEERLATKLGRAPTAPEVADALEMPLSQYYRLVAELNIPAPSPDSDLTGEIRSDAPDQEERLLDSQTQTGLRELVEGLPPRHRLVLQLVYFHDFSQKEAAKALDVSEPRVSQLRKEAVTKLRERAPSVSW